MMITVTLHVYSCVFGHQLKLLEDLNVQPMLHATVPRTPNMVISLSILRKTADASHGQMGSKMKTVISAAKQKMARLGVNHCYLDFAAPAKKVRLGPIIKLSSKMS